MTLQTECILSKMGERKTGPGDPPVPTPNSLPEYWYHIGEIGPLLTRIEPLPSQHWWYHQFGWNVLALIQLAAVRQ